MGNNDVGIRHDARILHGWLRDVGLGTMAFRTRSMRRSIASMIYKRPRTCARSNSRSGTRTSKARRAIGNRSGRCARLAEQLKV
jgi:hypothetical protein